MSKIVKNMIIGEIRDRLGECDQLLVVDSSRLDAITDNEFRLALREKGIEILQVKNSLACQALEDRNIEGLREVLSGPSTLVWGSEDIVALSKEMARWAKQIKPLEIKGGALEGKAIDAAGVERLSKSPSRLELIGQIAGLLLSPGSRLAGALLGPGGTICGQLKAMSESAEDDADTESAEDDADTESAEDDADTAE